MQLVQWKPEITGYMRTIIKSDSFRNKSRELGQ